MTNSPIFGQDILEHLYQVASVSDWGCAHVSEAPFKKLIISVEGGLPAYSIGDLEVTYTQALDFADLIANVLDYNFVKTFSGLKS
jgi:hypothetical protein